jgi:transposase
MDQIRCGEAAGDDVFGPRLNSAAVDGAVTALRAIVEHRDDLIKTRTQTVNRLHVVLTNLIPAGADHDLTADRAAELLRGIRPRDAAGNLTYPRRRPDR